MDDLAFAEDAGGAAAFAGMVVGFAAPEVGGVAGIDAAVVHAWEVYVTGGGFHCQQPFDALRLA